MDNLQLLFGPMLFGVFVNTLLYGVLISQTFIYHRTYRSDKPWIRYFVGYLFFVETLNTAIDWAVVYEPLVLRWGAERARTVVPVMLEADHIVMGVVFTPVQIFIAWRIKVVSGSRTLPCAIVLFSITSFIGGLVATVLTKGAADTITYPGIQKRRAPIIVWLAAAAIADILITGSLVHSLRKRKTGIKATDYAINRIIRLTIQTGMVTAVFASADVVIFATSKTTGINFFFDFPLSKLYTNSLLSTLNARAGWDKLNVTDDSNLLFGPDPTHTMTRSFKPREPSAPSKTAGIFELNELRNPPSSRNHFEDTEAGVNITKVVECFED